MILNYGSKLFRRLLLIVALFVSQACSPDAFIRAGEVIDAEWSEFRGPTGQGVSTAVGLPVTWSETESIVWKSPLTGEGWSSPVIRGDRVWLTSGDPDRKTLRAICFDRGTGQVIHNVV